MCGTTPCSGSKYGGSTKPSTNKTYTHRNTGTGTGRGASGTHGTPKIKASFGRKK